MLKSSLCAYSNVYKIVLVSRPTTVNWEEADDDSKPEDKRNEGVILKNCAPSRNCISKINNTQVDDAKYLDFVMPMYNLIQYSNNYSKTLESVWQYYRHEAAATIKNSESFKSKIRITGKNSAAGNTEDVRIEVPLKYLSNFWRTLEMPLLNCETKLILTWSADCVISSATGATKFAITDTKPYVPAVTLSTQDNVKLLEQLESGFKRTINWDKHLSKWTIERQNLYLDYFLTDPSFQGANRLFVLSFEDNEVREAHTGYFILKVETKDYNVMINGKNVFDQRTKIDMRTYDNIRKTTTSQRDDYTTGCLLDYPYFKEHGKL